MQSLRRRRVLRRAPRPYSPADTPLVGPAATLALVRQLFTWRFLAAVAALAGLALVVNAVIVDDDQLEAVLEAEIPDRRIDLIAAVFITETSDNFDIGRDGLTRGFVDFTLENRKIMRVAPGTRGEVNCRLSSISSCVVFVDLLGEAVIWFSVEPKAERNTVELGPIVDLEDGYALLDNGWRINYPPVIDRRCEGEDIVSFSDFLRRFGPGSTTVIDVATQAVLRVRCAGEDRVVVTTTTVPLIDVPIIGGEPIPGEEIDENDGVVEVPTPTGN
jgi:hypothetical protein